MVTPWAIYQVFNYPFLQLTINLTFSESLKFLETEIEVCIPLLSDELTVSSMSMISNMSAGKFIELSVSLTFPERQ